MKVSALCASISLLLGLGNANAFPIAAPGTEGLFVVVGTTGHVFATYQGNSATYSNDLSLGTTFIFNNHSTPVGTTVDLGLFTAGTELVFSLFVHDTGNTFLSGPASRNPDGHTHARAQGDYVANTTLVSFEDLYNGPFDYNDLSFTFTNTISATVIEPTTWALLGLGLVAGGSYSRRRRT